GAFQAKAESISVSVVEDDDNTHTKMKLVQDDYELHVDATQRFEVTEDETDIAALKDGGTLMIREKIDGRWHELTVRAADGSLSREYSRDGKRVEFDAQ